METRTGGELGDELEGVLEEASGSDGVAAGDLVDERLVEAGALLDLVASEEAATGEAGEVGRAVGAAGLATAEEGAEVGGGGIVAHGGVGWRRAGWTCRRRGDRRGIA